MSLADPVTQKWIRSTADEKAVQAGCWFDLKAADRVRAFFAKFLVHSKGEFAGKPFELLDWEWFGLIAPLYGWKRPDGTRRFRYVSAWVAKKNGKSTTGAALVINSLVNDNEPGAEVYGAAADRKQASVIYRESAAMVEASPHLRRRLQVIESTKRIVYAEKNSYYEVLSKESKKTGHGVNAHGVVLDEVHVCDRKLYDTLRYAGAARRQPIFFEISTAGDDPTSFGYDRYLYAKKVLAGEADDPELLPFVAEADSNDLWDQPEQWKKANPSLGHTISEERFRADFETARQGTALDKLTFCQLRLNIWQQQSAAMWLDIEQWDACSAPPRDYQQCECFGGLDLSVTTDVASLVLAFPHGEWPEPERVDLLCFFWIPEEACKRREKLNQQRFDRWALEGLVQVVPGATIDFGLIRKKINELRDAGIDIRIMGVDPYQAAQLCQELHDHDGFEVRKFHQRFSDMSPATKELERLVLTRRVAHGGHKVLRWMARNTAVHKNSDGDVKPCRDASREKIDGIVAAIMAVGAAMVAPKGGASCTVV